MTKETVFEEARKLPPDQQREVGELLVVLNTPDDIDPETGLTKEQLARLERTYEKYLRHPYQGRPAEEVFAELRRSLR